MSHENKKPTHGVYAIRNYTVEKQVRSEWTKLGVAWAHKEGNGFNIKLNCLPLDGELTIYPFADRKAEDNANPGEGA